MASLSIHSETFIDKMTPNIISRYEGNIEGFISATEKVTHNKITTLHMIDPIEIEIRGPKAMSESLCQITTRYTLEGLEYDKVTTCRLMSRLEKVEGAWKILTLEPIYIRDSMIAVAPQSPETIPAFKGAEKYPKSYRYGAWLLESIGIQSKLDLPNEDDRESVKKIIDANKEWLDSV